MMYPFTAHILVRNEDQFLKYALDLVLPYVSSYIIYDTGSTDKTPDILKKYKYEQKGIQTPQGITKLRNEMIAKTKTDWFLLLDGDEIWNKEQLINYLEFTLKQPKNIKATFLHTRNCVGDVFHYRQNGDYEIAGMKGSLNIRAYRKTVKWEGEYPLEHCLDSKDKNTLAFFEGYYWHLTHLKRSSTQSAVLGFRKQIFDLGIKSDNLPVSLKTLPKRSKMYEVIAAGAEIYRQIK